MHPRFAASIHREHDDNPKPLGIDGTRYPWEWRERILDEASRGSRVDVAAKYAVSVETLQRWRAHHASVRHRQSIRFKLMPW